MPTFTLPNSHIQITPFYNVNQDLYCLTNFSKHPITLNGITYPTTEHYFHAQKFSGQTQQIYLNKVLNASPSEALAEASRMTRWQRPWTPFEVQQWDQRREGVMENALRAKLNAYPEIRQALINTGNSCLVEDTAEKNEINWGWGNNGEGQNKLGLLWMKLRNEVFEQIGSSHLVVKPHQLYAQAQAARRPLGQRNTIMQLWPDVTKVSNSEGNFQKKNNLEKQNNQSDIFSFAKQNQKGLGIGGLAICALGLGLYFASHLLWWTSAFIVFVGISLIVTSLYQGTSRQANQILRLPENQSEIPKRLSTMPAPHKTCLPGFTAMSTPLTHALSHKEENREQKMQGYKLK